MAGDTSFREGGCSRPEPPRCVHQSWQRAEGSPHLRQVSVVLSISMGVGREERIIS